MATEAAMESAIRTAVAQAVNEQLTAITARVAMTDPVRPHRRTDVQWSTEAAGWSRASRAA